MQQLFYVAHLGEQQGPLSIDEIAKKIESGQLDANDYIFDEAAQDWVLLMAYAPLAQRLKPAKPATPPRSVQSPPQPEANADTRTVEWFVLKGDKRFGPFAYTDLLKMLQDKSVFEYDYVWHAGLKGWSRIAELAEFKPEAVRAVKNSERPDLTEVFFRRRHARISHGGSLLVHDNKSVWKGKSMEISGGGAGIVVENALLHPGQIVYLHFKPDHELPAFNAVCEVVNKKYMNVTERNSPVQYGVKFVHINESAQRSLKQFTDKHAPKAA